MKGMPHFMRRYEKLAREQGWEIRLSGSNHWILTNPHQPKDQPNRVVISGTPGNNPRTMYNAIAQLKRAGLKGIDESKTTKKSGRGKHNCGSAASGSVG